MTEWYKIIKEESKRFDKRFKAVTTPPPSESKELVDYLLNLTINGEKLFTKK